MNIIKEQKKSERGMTEEIKFARAERMAGELQKRLADARNGQEHYLRNASEFQQKQYVRDLMEAALCSERLTNGLRELTVGLSFQGPLYEAYIEEMISAHEILIQYEAGILMVELPCLMPHRKDKYTDFLYRPLYMALKRWCMGREEQAVPYYQRAVACLYHEYGGEDSGQRIRDHDNIEAKQLIDALGIFFLRSDGGLNLDTYQTSGKGERNRTHLFLMEKELFPGWFEQKLLKGSL